MRRMIRAVLAAAAAGLVVTAVAENDHEYKLQIARAPIASALTEFSRQTGLYVAYVTKPQNTVDVLVGPLQGQYTLEAAMEQITSGTGLTYQRVNSKTVAIVAKQAPPIVLARLDAEQPAAAAKPQARAHAAEAPKTESVETVIVTAQRRKERAQDVPISISVMDGVALDQGSSRGVSDVLNQVSSVSVVERQPGNSQIAIRGVVPDQQVGASTTAYYLDEIPFTFVTTAQVPDANAYDLARVEVLRGPQGTLYGANALSGVVRVLTNDADLDNQEIKGRVRASDTAEGGNNYGGDFALNLPLIPGELAIRGVASYSQLSGYIDSSFSGTKDINDTEAQAYRFKATYQPSDSINIKFGASRSQIDNGGPSHSLDDLTTTLSDDQRDVRKYDAYDLIGEFTWPSVSLLSSTSYVDYTADTHVELLLPGPFRLNFLGDLSLRSFAQEFRLTSSQEGAWRWSAGAIYKDTTETLRQLATAFSPQPFEEERESESYAIFGELTHAFADDRFELTGGLRYFQDDLTSTEHSNFFGPGTPPRPTDFDHVTGRVVLVYKPEVTRTWYASVATGFRSGQNQNTTVTTIDPSFGPLDPDELITYETGLKGSAAGGAFSYDLAAYYTKWDDIQQSVLLPVGFVASVNAANASGPGVDLAVAFNATDSLSMQASVGWSGLEFDQDVPSGAVVLFEKGERVNLSPEWTGSVGGSYRIAAALAGADLVLSGSFNYRSAVTLRFLSGADLSVSESDELRTLRASFGLEGERWSVDLYGDNLTDERGAVMPPESTFDNNSIRQRPRTIGVQGTFRY